MLYRFVFAAFFNVEARTLRLELLGVYPVPLTGAASRTP